MWQDQRALQNELVTHFKFKQPAAVVGQVAAALCGLLASDMETVVLVRSLDQLHRRVEAALLAQHLAASAARVEHLRSGCTLSHLQDRSVMNGRCLCLWLCLWR